MRTLRLFPLTFVAGSAGFAIFAPYLAAFLAVAFCLRHVRAAARVQSRA